MKDRSYKFLEDAHMLINFIEDTELRRAIGVQLNAIYCIEHDSENKSKILHEAKMRFSKIME